MTASARAICQMNISIASLNVESSIVYSTLCLHGEFGWLGGQTPVSGVQDDGSYALSRSARTSSECGDEMDAARKDSHARAVF